MTPEQRIRTAKFIVGYLPENLPSYRENTDKIKEIFGSFNEFKKASKIYWYYQLNPRYWNRGEPMSPLSSAYPAVSTEDGGYYYTYRHFLLNEKFSRYE